MGTPSFDDRPLAPGTRVLHIGPFKTGTTALQGAFCQARDELVKHDVIYPAGALRHWLRPTIALTGASSIRGHPKAEPRHWRQLVDAFDRAGDTTVLHSCEYFSDCEPEQIDRAVRELGGAHPMHVVITVRPLARILPSQWQMHIQGGWISTPYDEWLRQILDDAPIEPGDPTERFWHRHHHAELAARWAETVGPDNVTVIVADPHDRHALLRPFEAMLGLPTGMLDFPPGPVNESLPHNTIELLRRINREFDERGWDDAAYGKLIRHGATARMHAAQESLPAERGIRTPAWAQRHAVDIGNRIADRLGEIGVRVAGDLDHLRYALDRSAKPDDHQRDGSASPGAEPPGAEPPGAETAGAETAGAGGADDEGPEATLPVSIASQVAAAVVEADLERTAALRKALAKERRKTAEAKRELADVDASSLIRVLIRRGFRRIRTAATRSRDTQQRRGSRS